MAIDFPNSPVNGTVYSPGAPALGSWVYDGTKWNSTGSSFPTITLSGDTTGSGTTAITTTTVALQGRPVAATAPTTNQVLQWSGSAWTPTTVGGAGTVTNIATGTGLTGGPITNTGTIALSVPVSVANGGTGATTIAGSPFLPLVGGTLSGPGNLTVSGGLLVGTGTVPASGSAVFSSSLGLGGAAIPSNSAANHIYGSASCGLTLVGPAYSGVSTNLYWNGSNNTYLTANAGCLAQAGLTAFNVYFAPSGAAGATATLTSALTVTSSSATFSGGVTTGGSVNIGQGGDLFLARTDNSTGAIVRPNSAGYKNMLFCVAGGGALDNLTLNSVQTLTGGSLSLGGNYLTFNGATGGTPPFAYADNSNMYWRLGPGGGGFGWFNSGNAQIGQLTNDGRFTAWAQAGGSTDLAPVTIQTPTNSDCFLRINGNHQVGIGVKGTSSAGVFMAYDYTRGTTLFSIDTAGGMSTNGGISAGGNLVANGGVLYMQSNQYFQSTGGYNYCSNTFLNNGILPNSNNSVSCGLTGNAWAQVASFWFNNPSDIKLKQDIERVPDGALAHVMALAPMRYRYRREHLNHNPYGPGPVCADAVIPGSPFKELPVTDLSDEPLRYGFLAQDVREVMGEKFGGWRDDDGLQALSYNDLMAVLWRAVQELTVRLEELEASK